MADIGYRGVLTLFFDGIIAMMNPYPKPWKVRVRRVLSGWDGPVFAPEYAKIVLQAQTSTQAQEDADYPATSRTIHAMNAAHIIYECYTNRVWGRGLDRSRIDESSFLAAAQQLYNENFGLCLRWNRQSEVKDFIGEVINTIAGSTFTDRTTGKIKLNLIRGGYVFSDLPVFDPSSGLLSITENAVVSPTAQITECIVTYRDPVTDKERKVRSQNLGAVHGMSGGTNTLSRSYVGIPTSDLALRVAQRDLKAASSRLRRFTVSLDRRGWAVNPGDVIRIRDPYRNIPDTAVRVATVDNGTILNGEIKLQCVQDIFSLPDTSFTAAEPDRWAPPSSAPCLGEHMAFELPYYMALQSLTPADFAALTGDGALLGAVCEEGKTLNNAFDVMLKMGAPATDEAAAGVSYNCPANWS